MSHPTRCILYSKCLSKAWLYLLIRFKLKNFPSQSNENYYALKVLLYFSNNLVKPGIFTVSPLPSPTMNYSYFGHSHSFIPTLLISHGPTLELSHQFTAFRHPSHFLWHRTPVACCPPRFPLDTCYNSRSCSIVHLLSLLSILRYIIESFMINFIRDTNVTYFL